MFYFALATEVLCILIGGIVSLAGLPDGVCAVSFEKNRVFGRQKRAMGAYPRTVHKKPV